MVCVESFPGRLSEVERAQNEVERLADLISTFSMNSHLHHCFLPLTEGWTDGRMEEYPPSTLPLALIFIVVVLSLLKGGAVNFTLTI